jgi:hypothetical protein
MRAGGGHWHSFGAARLEGRRLILCTNKLTFATAWSYSQKRQRQTNAADDSRRYIDAVRPSPPLLPAQQSACIAAPSRLHMCLIPALHSAYEHTVPQYLPWHGPGACVVQAQSMVCGRMAQNRGCTLASDLSTSTHHAGPSAGATSSPLTVQGRRRCISRSRCPDLQKARLPAPATCSAGRSTSGLLPPSLAPNASPLWAGGL